jgi:hypothetical protein
MTGEDGGGCTGDDGCSGDERGWGVLIYVFAAA